MSFIFTKTLNILQDLMTVWLITLIRPHLSICPNPQSRFQEKSGYAFLGERASKKRSVHFCTTAALNILYCYYFS